MARPLQVSLVGGSLASLLWRGIEELHSSVPASPPWEPCPVCPVPSLSFDLQALDLPSLALGILIGLCLGPCLDLLHLLRLWWVAFVRGQLRLLTAREGPLFRVR